MGTRLRDVYETGRQVNDDPVVVVFEDFLDQFEAEQLIAVAESRLKQSLVSDSQSGVESAGRTARNCWIPHSFNPVIERLSHRVAGVVGMPLDHAESLQVIHYAATQQYAPHFDAWDAATESGQRCMARGGQRMVTCLMYLNDVEAGGGTSFPRLDMEVRAIKARMLLFHNCHPNSTIRHPDSLHGGLPVLQGEKWACNFWFREKQYQVPVRRPVDNESGKPTSFKRVI